MDARRPCPFPPTDRTAGQKRNGRRVAPRSRRSRSRPAGLAFLLDTVREDDTRSGERQQIPAIEPPPHLRHVVTDWGPELLANAEQYDTWIAAHQSLQSGELVAAQGERQLHPALGEISFTLGGRTIRAGGAPQALWHFNKVLTRARALTGVAKARVDALIQRTGGKRVMALTLARSLKRENYVLVVD